MRASWRILRCAVQAVAATSLAMPAVAGPHPEAPAWAAVRSPSAGPAQVIGSYANGCIGGAAALPTEGPGYQVIRLSRNRYYGHPMLVRYVQDLGRRVAAAGLGTMLVGDLGQPRGGPMSFGHASHQTGLDVDVWYRLDLPPLPAAAREAIEELGMVAGGRVDPQRWGGAQAALVRLAATDPRVGRIFVNPAVKLALCERAWPDRGWLRVVRPWFGHAGHFHVRLRCPADSPDCLPQEPPPEGDGCGEELMSWFRPPSGPPAPPREPPPLPAACAAVRSLP